jgi:CO/xanthine dehydrogenase FAD-binding subunit
MDVHRPPTLAAALHLKAEQPGARFVQGGTDLMVELNFDHSRPAALIDLSRIADLRGFSRDDGRLTLHSGITYAELEGVRFRAELPALAEAARTVGSPQIRNRGTIGGNLGTASPAGDALPPLLVAGAEVRLASVRGVRTLPLAEFLVGPKRSALAADELITAVVLTPSGAPQTFMKVGTRNAMVIAVCSLALEVDRERGEIRAAYGSAGPVAAIVTSSLADADAFPDVVCQACSPIDDVRGTAAYRRHALRVLARRGLERCLA